MLVPLAMEPLAAAMPLKTGVTMFAMWRDWPYKDQLLANISLYWFTGAVGSSFWPYCPSCSAGDVAR